MFSPPSSAVVKKGQSYTYTPPISRTACTEPQCLYKGDLYLYFLQLMLNVCLANKFNQVHNSVQYIYLFLLCTCFGHSCAHKQEKITVSMRHWHLLLCIGGVWSAGWTVNPTSRPDYTGTHGQQNIKKMWNVCICLVVCLFQWSPVL